MLRKDYIQRQFEDFGKFLATLIGLKSRKKWQEIERQINESAAKYTSIEIEATEKMTDDDLISELTEARKLKDDQMKMLADLLYEKGVAYTELLRDEEARNTFVKALAIYNYLTSVALQSDFALDTHFRIRTIKQLLGQ